MITSNSLYKNVLIDMSTVNYYCIINGDVK